MAHRIDTVEARSKLKARRPPYWHKLSNGCHLGFRKMTPSSEGTWLAQAYDSATRKQTRKSLGSFDNLIPSQRFDAAKKAAEAWHDHMGKGGSTETVTVRLACERHVAHVRGEKGDKAADDIEARFARHVYPEPISSMEIPKLTRKHVEAWRRALTKKPVVANPHASQKVTRPRAPSTINRDMSALRAAMNRAHDDGAVTSDMAWRVVLRPIENADGSRDVYLDRAQRSALIQASPDDLATFLRGLATVPLRPGALAVLKVSSFDKRLDVLAIGKDKAGRDRKIKLPRSTAQFFEAQTKDKLPAAPLLSRANGKHWTKDSWKKPVKLAAKAAGLDETITAYALRHSSITDLVTGGLDLLTVAQLSGTSVAMIEKHYGHLRADHAAAALANLAL